MDVIDLARIVSDWAAAEPAIGKAWIFGSRARWTERPDSDLDVAVVIRPMPGDSGPFATWMGESQDLSASLQKLLPVTLQLEWYGGPEETPIIHAGLNAGSMLVYVARDTQGTPPAATSAA